MSRCHLTMKWYVGFAKAQIKGTIIIDYTFKRAFLFDHQLSCCIVDYHQLSFNLSLFIFFMIVVDSFCRFTTCMIVDASQERTVIDYHAPFDQSLFNGKANKFLTFPEFTREYILNAVSKCPAAGHGLKLTKCPAVRNIHRIPTEILNQT